MSRPVARACSNGIRISILAWIVSCAWPSQASAQGTPIVEFVSDRVYVLEDSGSATLQISLSGLLLTQASVIARTTDDTADIDDYVDTHANATWGYRQGGIREVTIQIRVDSQVEPDERFFVDLDPNNQGYFQLGDRTRAEVIILNDDGALRPYFEVNQPMALTPDGRGLYLAPQNAQVQLLVRLSGPAPAGFSVDYLLDGGGPWSLPFPEGSQQAMLAVPAPTEPGPDPNFGTRTLELLSAMPSKQGWPDKAIGMYEIADAIACVMCAMLGVGYDVNTADESCPFYCPSFFCKDSSKLAFPDPGLVLQEYRDQILTATPEGQFYIDLYNELSPSIVHTMFEQQELYHQFRAARNEWSLAFQALVDGTGDGFEVLPTMQANLSVILDTLEGSSHAPLVEAVQRERSRLMLDSITGLTMAQLQERLETLGGGVPTGGVSWGSLKANYDKK